MGGKKVTRMEQNQKSKKQVKTKNAYVHKKEILLKEYAGNVVCSALLRKIKIY